MLMSPATFNHMMLIYGEKYEVGLTERYKIAVERL